MPLTKKFPVRSGITLIALLSIISILTPAPISAAPQSTAQSIYLQLRNNANVRSLPSLSSAVVTVLPKGTQVVWSGQSGEWLYILSQDGRRGWINQLTVESIPALVPLQDPYWLNATTNILAEPKPDAPVITPIFPLQKVTLISHSNGWQQVRTADYLGWINTTQNPAQPAEEEFLYGTVYAIKTGNVRQYPHQEAPIIGKIYNGDSLLVIGNWNDWYHVLWNQQNGYVHSILLMPDSLKPFPYHYIKVIKDGNLRKRPDLNAPILDKLQTGQTGYRLKQQADWNLVYFPYFTLGWVHDVLIEVTHQPPLQRQSQLDRRIADLVQQARQARQKRAFADAIRAYRAAQDLLRRSERLTEITECLMYHQVIIQYAFSDHLYYPYSQANNPSVGKLQSLTPDVACYDAVQTTLKEWQQGFEFRTNLLNLFNQKAYPVENLIKSLDQNPSILPLPLEAEAHRFLGRYFTQSGQKEVALLHQKASVLIYRLLKEQDLLTAHAQLGNYFEVLCELAQNYLDLGQLHPSMAVLDDVYRLIQQNNREDWNQRYLKLFEQVTAAGPR